MTQKLLTPEEAAAQFGVSPETIRRWCRQGKLQGVKVGEQWRVISEDEQPPLAEEDLLTPAEAAKALRVSTETVRRWCRRGAVRHHRVGGQWRIPRAEVERILREGVE